MMLTATHLSRSRLGPLQDGSRDEPTHQPESDTGCNQGDKVPNVFRGKIVKQRRGPARRVGQLGGAIPDDEVGSRDLIARSSSEVAKVREGRPSQGYTGREVEGRGDRGNHGGGCIEIPGRLNAWTRVDEVRDGGEGNDDCVDLLDDRDEREKGRGGCGRIEKHSRGGWNGDSKDEDRPQEGGICDQKRDEDEHGRYHAGVDSR